jgi:apolipoprotein N-acyltransferase
VSVNGFLWAGVFFYRTHRGRALGCVLAAAVAVCLPMLVPTPSANGPRLRVAIVQGNVPRSFTGNLLAKEEHIIRSHVRLTKQLAGQHPDLVVWPESAVGIDPRHDPAVAAELASAARSVHADMIVGGNLNVDRKHYEVVALLISPSGKISDIYQKTHLVPFGEYVPGRRFLSWIPMLDQIPEDAVPAPRGKLFTIHGEKVAPVLSFEGDFGSLVRGRIASGGRLLVVATNTSTWGTTPASAQHVAMSQVRSAENGVWTVHAALSGISAFIAPDGAIAASTPLWHATSLVRTVRFSTRTTFYARTGDWLPLACLAASLIALGMSLVRRRTEP